MITVGQITEQIFRLHVGGNPDADREITFYDVRFLMGQVVNRILKTEHLSVNVANGEHFPPHVCIASYTADVTAVDANTASEATLPVFPMNLPRQMGVWSVASTQNPHDKYIPIQTGQWSLVSANSMLSVLEGHVGYEVIGNKIRFTENLITDQITEVALQLLVQDVTTMTDTDVLPVPPELEDTIIQETLKVLSTSAKPQDVTPDSNDQA